MTAIAIDPSTNGTADSHASRKRRSVLRWIKIEDLQVAEHAQRPFLPHWANEMAADFDLENMGHFVVSHRGDHFYVIDGQHRLEALKIIGFDGQTTVPCEVYENLTPRQESELFLDRNHVKPVAPLATFRVAVDAGRHDENEINSCVRAQGLTVGRTFDGGVSAVGALRNVYRRVGAVGLGKVLRIIRDAYGDAGFVSAVIDGLGLVIQRYNGTIQEEHVVKALASANGGLNGLLTQASKTRALMGESKAVCIAATTVGYYNRQSGAKKLAPWWSDADELVSKKGRSS